MKQQGVTGAKPDTATRVVQMIASKLEVELDQVVPTAKLAEDLGADSLDTVQLSFELENEFDIEITERDAKRLLTVGDVIAYIEKHCRQ
jgi:acyl carrier protein